MVYAKYRKELYLLDFSPQPKTAAATFRFLGLEYDIFPRGVITVLYITRNLPPGGKRLFVRRQKSAKLAPMGTQKKLHINVMCNESTVAKHLHEASLHERNRKRASQTMVATSSRG
jgi:hypothetical protein